MPCHARSQELINAVRGSLQLSISCGWIFRAARYAPHANSGKRAASPAGNHGISHFAKLF
jgi:hypothetical protein